MLEYFPEAKLFKSYSKIEDLQKDQSNLKEVAICGRSNSGKSSLINVLCNQKQLAFVSSIPGKTRTINFYYIPSYKSFYKEFFLVDLPGYGYAQVSKKEKFPLTLLVDQYIEKSKNLKLLLLIIDAKRNFEQEELSIINYCKDYKKNFIILRSKWDRFNQKEKNQLINQFKQNAELFEKTIFISSLKKYNISIVIQKIIESLEKDE